MGLSRLAALHGVATSYAPSADVTVSVPDDTVVAVLAALGVDAATPGAVRESLAAAESVAASRLLPPTLVVWAGEPLPPALTALRPGTTLEIEPEDAAGSPPPPRMRVPSGRPDPAVSATAGTVVGAAADPVSARALDAAALGAAPPGTAPVGTAVGTGRPGSAPGAPAPTPAWWTEPPLGVHRLTVRAQDGRTVTTTLIVAPARVPQPPRRTHGFLVQLYSLLSGRSWGMGDLGDLADLAAWSGRTLGAGFVQVNPLHAAVPGTPTDPSPYRPSSRRFPDPVHLQVESIPEYGHVPDRARPRRPAAERRNTERHRPEQGRADRPGRRLGAQASGSRTRTGGAADPRPARRVLRLPRRPGAGPGGPRPVVRPRGGARLRLARLAVRTARPPLPAGRPRACRAARPGRLPLPARLADRRPARRRPERRAGRRDGRRHRPRPRRRRAPRRRRRLGPAGRLRARHVGRRAPGRLQRARSGLGAAARGAPTSSPRPATPRTAGCCAACSRHAGALRIDHVMGLFRLWWVPEGRPPTEGTYVSHDAEAMLAVLVLEAHRAGAVVIGEDLGTVEPGVRESLARRGVLGTSVLWFERDWTGTGRPLPPERWREGCLATATTHDLPSTAARLTGDHVTLRHRLGLLTRTLEQEQAEDATDIADVARPARPARPAAGGRGRRGGGGPRRPPLPAAHPCPHGRRLAPGHGRRPPAAESARHLGPVPQLAAARRGCGGPPGHSGGARRRRRVCTI